MPRRKSKPTIYEVDTSKPIFVFGSNLAGVHGAGAALFALMYYGAEYGVGVGRTGHSYALPTKDQRIITLPLNVVKHFVDTFLNHAEVNPEDQFFVTRIGCGLAGYKDEEIAPLFRDAPTNCLFDSEWATLLPEVNKSRLLVVSLSK